MHEVIRAVTYGKDEDEAFENATEIFERLIQAGAFDYYRTFDELTGFPMVARADTEEGKELIEDGMTKTWWDFKEMITKVREGLKKYSDEEIFEREPNLTNKIVDSLTDNGWSDLSLLTFFMSKCYRGRPGPQVWLYDNDGEPIENRRHLENVLNKWDILYEKKGKTNPFKDLDVFVVPANVHF